MVLVAAAIEQQAPTKPNGSFRRKAPLRNVPAHPVNEAGPDFPMRSPADQRSDMLEPDPDFRDICNHASITQRLQSGRWRDQAACMVDDRGDRYFAKRL